ncbi:DDHD domain-containing protein [Limtongia smithiae]|uniref:DDHD domain-containing protein n=1 Tax=Limtongia smithiae TaxID=1125753 RepID=UPI0034CE1527
MPGKGIEGVVRRGFDYFAWKNGGGKEPETEWSANDVEHLVFVIHGIGQKLSERVETFDFTYAINNFRVLMAKQHESLALHKPPPAVLPINWRRKINFDYEDVTSASSEEDYLQTNGVPIHRAFSLADITPSTIPTVRNIISDVLLDIPYYLSRHKPRVLHAVAAEANRIYRLWMRNNPGWRGKVSIIGHSLGSVIAVDILSKQPTVPPPLYSQNENSSEEAELLLEFPVRNFFVAGSPVGFFLLLNRVNLMPRIMSQTRLSHVLNYLAQSSDGNVAEAQALFASLTSNDIGINHGGVYGCLAVENIYNVIHTSDPIAYRLNPCVDPNYAERIKRTSLMIPISQESLISRVFRRASGAESDTAVPSTALSLQRKARDYNTTYSFTRGPTAGPSSRPGLTSVDWRYQKVIDARMRCLNENGQIDYVVQPSGPLDNQYISILTAHSGYWENKEFAYLVAVECSREPGVDNTLEDFNVAMK